MNRRKLVIVSALLALPLILGACSPIGKKIEEALRMKPDYYKSVVTGGPLEQTYTNFGPSKTDSYEFKQGERQYKVWYPSELKTASKPFPAVVMSNGSGIKFPAYEATFQHLASWGFVVIGDDVDSTATGETVSLMVDRLLMLNSQPGVFQNRIDTTKIGVSGHSQGAVGAVNAVTRSKNGRYFKSAYLASMTRPKIIEDFKWDTWRYDTSTIKIPVFIVAGTGKSDSDSISPLEDMTRVFNSLKDNGLTALSRRKDTDHGDMLVKADGYMTAWFRYTLLNDPQAAGVFTGKNPELLGNTKNWQDVRIK